MQQTLSFCRITLQDPGRLCSEIYAFHHIFDRLCDENDIEHRLTKVKHPWTNGQAERMNRTIKEATVKGFGGDSGNCAGHGSQRDCSGLCAIDVR
ncbi:hypothetical protein GGE46_006232 [Rhizobium etli]|uniref:Uncharacterized protein n=1 Tax=Rhizobium etli TaxID=29449 RepID=A0A7W6VG39_RHIET|nr:hypothetical protein [Rhizobium etli]MBB4539433.1 hypothetical protein [Rhizobium etli]